MIKLDEETKDKPKDIIVKPKPKQKEEKEEPTKETDVKTILKTIEEIGITEENNKFSITL